MTEKQEIDISNWNRKEHFDWFNSFEEPYAGVTVMMDVTKAYEFSKGSGYKFSLFYFYLSLRAANETEALRYRIEGDKVVCYSRIGGDTTIFREDLSYGCGHYKYYREYAIFEAEALREMARVEQSKGLCNDYEGIDTIYYSTVPWIHFTALNHPRKYGANTGVPRITFGKIIEEKGRKIMPVDLHFHHALMGTICCSIIRALKFMFSYIDV